MAIGKWGCRAVGAGEGIAIAMRLLSFCHPLCQWQNDAQPVLRALWLWLLLWLRGYPDKKIIYGYLGIGSVSLDARIAASAP